MRLQSAVPEVSGAMGFRIMDGRGHNVSEWCSQPVVESHSTTVVRIKYCPCAGPHSRDDPGGVSCDENIGLHIVDQTTKPYHSLNQLRGISEAGSVRRRVRNNDEGDAGGLQQLTGDVLRAPSNKDHVTTSSGLLSERAEDEYVSRMRHVDQQPFRH